MTHYTKDYNGLLEHEVQTKAIADIKFWLGGLKELNERAKIYTRGVESGEIANWGMWCFCMGMMGVSYFTPCKAFAIYCGVWERIKPTDEELTKFE